MHIALINTPTLARRPVSRSMAGGLGFDGSEEMLLPPLDLAVMAATLREAGDEVDLIDADPLRLDDAAVQARLDGRSWDALIASVSLPSLDGDATFLAELRRCHPAAKVFAKTLIRDARTLELLLRKSGVHAVIHGEPELTIGEVIRGRTRSGTAWLEPDPSGGEPRFCFDKGEPIADLNQLPLPARDLLPNDRYVYPLLGTRVATLQTSRGCPYPCGYFCPYPLVEGVKWRSQSPERIAAELKQVVETFGITKIYFRDATFTLNQERIVRLCHLIRQAGWKLEWVCETRVDCLSDSLLSAMRVAGCVGILIGVETGDEGVMHLREGKKGLTVSKLARVRETARRLGIRLHFLLIVGLPQETRESIVATYDLIQRYQPDTVGVTIITPYPGTPLYEEAVRNGWIDSSRAGDYGGHQVPMHTLNLTREDLVIGKRFLEEGFGIMQRKAAMQDPALLDAVEAQHYEQLLRWAYRLDDMAATITQALAQPNQAPAVVVTQTPASAPRATAVLLRKSSCAISVILPTYNRRAILRKTLLAYASQTLPAEQFEVLIVDDGSTDDTVAMARAFKAPFALRVLTQSHRGANAARNMAIRAAQGDLVVLSGDDMIPEPNFLEEHLKFHRLQPAETEAMLGFIDWSPELSVSRFMRYIVAPEGGQQFAFHTIRNGTADFRMFYTSNMSVKRSLLARQARLFDTDFVYPAYDDVEFGYRLSQQGLRINFNARAITKHHHPMTPASFVERQRRAGHMAVLLAHKHPALDKIMLGITETAGAARRGGTDLIHNVLGVIAEAEKADERALNAIHLQGMGFAEYYAKTVLYPLYGIVLNLAYQEGIRAALERPQTGAAVPSSSQRFTVSIIIPVFNKVELTRQCLVALAEVTEGVDYEVIVVDDGSTDGTQEFVKTLGGDVQIIRNAHNSGFAKSCNRGAAAARGRYLVFLNNDTIPLKGWLSELVKEVEAHSEVAAVGSKLLYPDGTIQHAGVVFSKLFFSPYHIYNGFRGDHPVVNRRREFDSVTAACVLFRREAFDSVGGFDEGYRNSFEDVDLCLKVREKGWHVVYQPASVLYHLESQSPGRKAHDRENALRLQERWAHQWWLPDEDVHYVADGFAQRLYDKDGQSRVRLDALSDPATRAKWEVVAEAQRLARRQELDALRASLNRSDLWPDDVPVLQWAAAVCRLVGLADRAGSFWERILSLGEDAPARVALAQEALGKGQLDAAERHLDAAHRHAPTSAQAWFLRGVLEMQRQAFAEASRAFERACREGADLRKARLGLCMAHMGEGKAEAAWDLCRCLMNDHPDDQEVVHWLVRAGAVVQRWAQLADDLGRYVLRNPADLSARFAYAGALVRLGRLEDARREHDTIRLLNPGFEGLAELAKAVAQPDLCMPTHGRA